MNIVVIAWRIMDIMSLTIAYGGKQLTWKLVVQTFMNTQRENWLKQSTKN